MNQNLNFSTIRIEEITISEKLTNHYIAARFTLNHQIKIEIANYVFAQITGKKLEKPLHAPWFHKFSVISTFKK